MLSQQSEIILEIYRKDKMALYWYPAKDLVMTYDPWLNVKII